jgi:predicted nucleic acid-binding protein
MFGYLLYSTLSDSLPDYENPLKKAYICRDKDDNVVIETAIMGQADFLVTRDDDIKFDKAVSSFLKKYGISVISIAKFITHISKSQLRKNH